jgi:hypothetical protein
MAIRRIALWVGRSLTGIAFVVSARPPTGRDVDTAFARLAQKPIDALLVGPGPLLDNRRVQLATLAAYHWVPAKLRLLTEQSGNKYSPPSRMS